MAWQTPTATASWPIATWRKPGSSPARNRSSTFSSKRRISSISRRNSRSLSCDSAPRLLSTFATPESMLRGVPVVSLGASGRIIESSCRAAGDVRLAADADERRSRSRARRRCSDRSPRAGRRELSFEAGAAARTPAAVTRALRRLDVERIRGTLELVGREWRRPAACAPCRPPRRCRSRSPGTRWPRGSRRTGATSTRSSSFTSERPPRPGRAGAGADQPAALRPCDGFRFRVARRSATAPRRRWCAAASRASTRAGSPAR